MDTRYAAAVGDERGRSRRGHGRPRVLGITTQLSDTDQARHAVGCIQALQGQGFDTRLVAGRSREGDGGIHPPAKMAYSHLPWLGEELRPGDDLRATLALAGLVRRWKPDVVHTHLGKAGALGRLVGLRAGVPILVHTFHEEAWNGRGVGVSAAAILAVERTLAARTDAMIAMSTQLRDEMIALEIGHPARWHVVAAEDHAGFLATLYTDLLERPRTRLASEPLVSMASERAFVVGGVGGLAGTGGAR